MVRTLRRVGSVTAGIFGAEVVGAAGFAVGAAMIATDWFPMAMAGIVLLPVLAAAGGPFGYDMAQSWVPEEERGPRAVAGSRAAAHAAGVAAALLLVVSCLGVAVALPTSPTVALFALSLFGLPCLAVLGRRLVIRSFSDSVTLLPVSLVVIVGATPALVFLYMLLLGRFMGED